MRGAPVPGERAIPATARLFKPLAGATVLLALLVSPWFLTPYPLHIVIMTLLFAAAGSAWNIVGGYAGQLSLGHAAFFGIGAYTTTLLQIHLKVSPWVGMWAGALLAVVAAVLIGWATLRLQGPYFAIATIAFAEVLRLTTLHLRDFTGGAVGLTVPYLGNRPWYFQFEQKVYYYYVILALVLGIVATVRRMASSRLGYYLIAIGQNETVAEAVGVPAVSTKLKALTLSAFLTALCGTFYAQYIYFIDPFSVLSLGLSIEFALVAIVGGVRTVWGPVLGAALLRPLTELTQAALGATYAGVQLIVYGSLLILVILLRPEGLIGPVSRIYTRLIRRLEGDHA
jgi:branched-chain amino acid transport system permease protein